MRRAVAMVVIAACIAVTAILFGAAQAKAVTFDHRDCWTGPDGTSQCVRYYIGKSSSWPKSTFRLNSFTHCIRGNVGTLEETRSLVVTNPRLRGKDNRELWQGANYSLSQNDKCKNRRVMTKFNRNYEHLSLPFTWRDNGAQDRTGLVWVNFW